jgi:hypothetical protein
MSVALPLRRKQDVRLETSFQKHLIHGIGSVGTTSFIEGTTCFPLPQSSHSTFTSRWHGDPATTRPVQARGAGAGPSNAAGDDPDEDNQPIDFGDPMMVNGLSGLNHDRNNHVAFLNPQALRDNPLPPPLPQSSSTGGNGPIQIPPLANGVDPGVANLSINANVVNILMQFVQMQSQASKMKLEYLRRRDDREEKESLQRREMQRLKMEREASEFEFKQQTEMHKQKTEKALVSFFSFLRYFWPSLTRLISKSLAEVTSTPT